MTVVPFQAANDESKDGPWLSGEAHCIECRHRWAAVAPVGTWQLECPECRSMKGIYTMPVSTVEPEDYVLTCQCGCEALTAYRRQGYVWLRCMRCGADQTETYFT